MVEVESAFPPKRPASLPLVTELKRGADPLPTANGLHPSWSSDLTTNQERRATHDTSVAIAECALRSPRPQFVAVVGDAALPCPNLAGAMVQALQTAERCAGPAPVPGAARQKLGRTATAGALSALQSSVVSGRLPEGMALNALPARWPELRGAAAGTGAAMERLITGRTLLQEQSDVVREWSQDVGDFASLQLSRGVTGFTVPAARALSLARFLRDRITERPVDVLVQEWKGRPWPPSPREVAEWLAQAKLRSGDASRVDGDANGQQVASSWGKYYQRHIQVDPADLRREVEAVLDAKDRTVQALWPRGWEDRSEHFSGAGQAWHHIEDSLRGEGQAEAYRTEIRAKGTCWSDLPGSQWQASRYNEFRPCNKLLVDFHGPDSK